MKRGLTTDDIAGACQELLQRQRRVRVLDVTHHLLQTHGTKGKTERIAAILKEQKAAAALPSPSEAMVASGVAALLERVRIAEERAEQAELRAHRAEELERRHQDFWATRYAERVEELERRYAELARPTSGVSADQYLKVCQLNAELTRRLELYEWERAQGVNRS